MGIMEVTDYQAAVAVCVDRIEPRLSHAVHELPNWKSQCPLFGSCARIWQYAVL